MSQSSLPFWQIDAFASRPFEGNQACVMPMGAFLDDAVLQAIAAENNVAETAFIVQSGDETWDLRWFTPTVEVPLCGHATLASAHVLFNELKRAKDTIRFETRHSGSLFVNRLDDGRLEMDFPAPAVRSIDVTEDIIAALGARPLQAWAGPFLAVWFDTEDQIRQLNPDLNRLKDLLGADDGWDRGNVGCLAPGASDFDIVSRFFAPGSGIDEDPATGSWHCMVAAVVAEKDGSTELVCHQAFPGRGARIETRLLDDRVRLIGTAVTVIEGRFISPT
ncbi:MAG: PhzF family phenazine biosynthesis protein [Pseudomonadota bacterium]